MTDVALLEHSVQQAFRAPRWLVWVPGSARAARRHLWTRLSLFARSSWREVHDGLIGLETSTQSVHHRLAMVFCWRKSVVQRSLIFAIFLMCRPVRARPFETVARRRKPCAVWVDHFPGSGASVTGCLFSVTWMLHSESTTADRGAAELRWSAAWTIGTRPTFSAFFAIFAASSQQPAMPVSRFVASELKELFLAADSSPP